MIDFDIIILNSLLILLGTFIVQLLSSKLSSKLGMISAAIALPRLSFIQIMRFIILPISLLILTVGVKITLGISWLEAVPLLAIVAALLFYNVKGLNRNDKE